MGIGKLIYSLSLAELLDRANIVLMKIAHSDKFDNPFQKELIDILHDIQIHLDETPLNAEAVKGLIVLTQVNSFIWQNEEMVRDVKGDVEDSVLLAKLKESHKANSLRAEAKKHIQNQRNGRIDNKLNYSMSENFWNIHFKTQDDNEQWRYM